MSVRVAQLCISQFVTGLKNRDLPNVSWLVPNGYDDEHDSTAKAEIAPSLAGSYFKAGGDGLQIVTFDDI
ncbi:MAG: alkaline phosphatase family protein [Bryobacteraceae bacterium]|jgi:phospholipase C